MSLNHVGVDPLEIGGRLGHSQLVDDHSDSASANVRRLGNSSCGQNQRNAQLLSVPSPGTFGRYGRVQCDAMGPVARRAAPPRPDAHRVPGQTRCHARVGVWSRRRDPRRVGQSVGRLLPAGVYPVHENPAGGQRRRRSCPQLPTGPERLGDGSGLERAAVAPWGALATAVSDTDLSPHSAKCVSRPSRIAGRSCRARRRASRCGSISDGRTVP